MDESWSERLARLLDSLARMAGGDLDHRIALGDRHDELDAVAHAVNVLVGELQLTTAGLRRAKEQAEAASVAKTMFLRNASHEIRTPLTVVLGMADLIASRKVPEERIKTLHQRITANGRALAAILDDLLDLAKVEAARLEFESRDFGLGSLTREVVAGFEVEASRKGIALAYESLEPADPAVLADVKRTRQILTNVIGNAVKFTAEGRVLVRLRRSDDAKQVLVDVEDSGVGMTEDQARALFEPFAQADASIARRFGGSGLGLALSKRFAEAMGGGLVLLESHPEGGSTFRLSLPAGRAAAAGARAVTRDLRRPDGELRGRRLLVVEDNDDVRATTSEMLRLAGAVVFEAATGEQALERCRAASFDAIVMDLRMPGIGGLEATRRLRARGVTAVIVGVTADAVANQKARCLEAGCSGYLAKPFELDQLLSVLRAHGFRARAPE